MNRTPRTENLTRLSSEEARQRIARGESESDWARVNAIPDDEIGADDPDALPMTDEELATAPILRRPGNDLVHAAVRYLLSNKQLTALIPGGMG